MLKQDVLFDLAGDLRQEVSSHSRDARQALLQHDLQHGGAVEHRVRPTQKLRVAGWLWSDQKKRAMRAKHAVQPLEALRLTAKGLTQELQGLSGRQDPGRSDPEKSLARHSVLSS